MAQLKFGSAGVTAREIDISGPVAQQPVGIPAGIIGTSLKGPAFVPITVGTLSDWYSKFGATDGKKFGPLGVVEGLRNARSVTYLKVLGVGDGRMRNVDGTVTSAGFVVGEEQPNDEGTITANEYAVLGGDEGRPHVAAFPDAPASQAYIAAAGAAAQQLSILNAQTSGILNQFALDWKN